MIKKIFSLLLLLTFLPVAQLTVQGTDIQVFCSSDFNDSVAYGLSIVDKGNTVSIQQDASGNGYLLMDKTIQDSDPYFDITIHDGDLISQLVLSTQISSKSLGATFYLFRLRDESRLFTDTLRVTPSGSITLYDGTPVASIDSTRFVSLAAIYDFTSRTFDVYVDGVKTVNGVSFQSPSFGLPASLRCQLMPSQGNGQIMLDNFQVYTGDELLSMEETNPSGDFTVLPDDGLIATRLEGCVAFHQHSSQYFSAGAKHALSAPLLDREGTLYVPADSFAAAFGLSYERVQQDLFLGASIHATIGSRTVSLEGGSCILAAPPILSGDTAYLPLESFSSLVMGYASLHHDSGLIILSQGTFPYADNESILEKLSMYLFSVRPNQSQIQQLFSTSGYANVHPRILANASDFARLRQLSTTNAQIQEWTENVLFTANQLLSAPPLDYSIPDGLRLLNTSRAVQERLLSLGYAYQITEDERYAQRAWVEMEHVASYPDWNPKHFLDTAEMTFGMAIGYDWCYDYLSPDQRETIETAITKFGLKEGKKQYQGQPTGTYFVFQDMNWNAVCNGGLSVGALAIFEKEPQLSSYTLSNALHSLEYMLGEFSPEGGWVEGPGYWSYTLKFFCLWMQAMKYPLGTDFGIPAYPGISKTAYFLFSMEGNCGCNNFNDAGSGHVVAPELFWLGRYFDDAAVTRGYLNSMEQYRINGSVLDCLYYDTDISPAPPNLPLDITTARTQTGSMRSSWTDMDGMYLSFSGGKTQVNHYHIDSGSFVLDMLGERWALDLGSDNLTYTPDFSASRNDVYRIRPEGHNTIVINPSADPGQEMSADCPIIAADSKQRGAYQVLDLTSAYSSWANSAVRGYMLTDNRRTAVIRDEITLKEPSSVYWFMHTTADITLLSDTRALLTIGGKQMQLDMVCTGGNATLSSMDAVPLPTTQSPQGEASNAGVRKVMIVLEGSGDVSISVRLTPANETPASTTFSCDTIANWTLPDGPLPEPEDPSTHYSVYYQDFSEPLSSSGSSWSYPDLDAVWSAHMKNSSTTLTTLSGLGSRPSQCLALVTDGYPGGDASSRDPYLRLTPNSPIQQTATLEFWLYLSGEDTTFYLQQNASTLLSFLPDHSITAAGAGVLPVTWEDGGWISVAITLYYSQNKMDIWLNSEQIVRGAGIALSPISSFKWLSFFPEQASPEGYSALLAIDGVRLYTGDIQPYAVIQGDSGPCVVISGSYPCAAVLSTLENGRLSGVSLGGPGSLLSGEKGGQLRLFLWRDFQSLLPLHPPIFIE